MTLEELGRQYLEQAKVLTEHIHELNKEAKKLTGEDLILMKRRILSLYNDVAECKKTALHLIYYYEPKP